MNLIKHIASNKAKDKYKELGLSDELITIFLKQRKYRTSKDNIYLYQNFEHFDCFQKIIKNYKEGELMLETIFKKLDFVILDPGKIIYSPNDIISNMFYIFYGTVKIDKDKINTLQSLRSPKKMKKRNKIKEKKSFRKLGFVIKLMNAMKKGLVQKENDLNEEDINDNEYILTKGDEYGFEEINSNRRNDLVKAKSTCIIGFLSKEDWQYIFEKIDVIKRNDILKFLEGLQIMKNRKSDKIINNIYNSINERFVNIGDTLINFGEELTKFYIIRKGYFQVEIKMKEKVINIFNDLDSFGNYNQKEKTENIKYEAKNYYTKEENYKIITYGKGEFLGDIEFYLGSKKYLTKILCKSSSSVVYEIKYEDLMNHMTHDLKETLIKEGKAKLDYFRKRIKEMKILKATKFSNKNRYKQIILNKLEEEKGEIFIDMENKKNGFFLYEQKRRKRLKTASLKKNIKDIYINNELLMNKYMIKMKQNKNKIKSNYLSIFNNKNSNIDNNKHIFPTSVKKNKTNYKLFQNDFMIYNENKFDSYNYNNKNSRSKMWNTVFNNSLTPDHNEKRWQIKNDQTLSTLFNSNQTKNIYYINNAEIKNKINSNNINNIKTIDISFSPNKDIKRFILGKKYMPKSPNEKILKAYSLLCNDESKRKQNFKTNEANRINYINTQEYSFLKTNDKSINDIDNKNKNVYTMKKSNRFHLKDSIPLLTEIVNNKKKLNLKGLYSEKSNNHKINYK